MCHVHRDVTRVRHDEATAHLDPLSRSSTWRVASKSVRCRELLGRVLGRAGWRGVLAYSLPEAIWLVRAGVTRDAVVAYPPTNRVAGRRGFRLVGLLGYEARIAGVGDAPPGQPLDGGEGAGEVQTPLRGAAADGLRLGDWVWLRHAKAGELCEHVNELCLVEGAVVTGVALPGRGPRLLTVSPHPRGGAGIRGSALSPRSARRRRRPGHAGTPA